MVESRAAHLKQEAPEGEAAGGADVSPASSNGDDDGHLVKLNGKPKKAKKKPSNNDRGLF